MAPRRAFYGKNRESSGLVFQSTAQYIVTENSLEWWRTEPGDQFGVLASHQLCVGKFGGVPYLVKLGNFTVNFLSMVSFSSLNTFIVAALLCVLLSLTFGPSEGRFLFPAFPRCINMYRLYFPIYLHALIPFCFKLDILGVL